MPRAVETPRPRNRIGLRSVPGHEAGSLNRAPGSKEHTAMKDERPTASLRRRHAELVEGLARLWLLVESLAPGEEAKKPELLRAVNFLERELLPHAEGEDCFLYPEVGRLMGCHRATGTMNMDHHFISMYVRELRGEIDRVNGPAAPGLSEKAICDIRAAANRLRGLLQAHFEKEEQLYLELLDEKFTSEEVRQRISDPMSAMAANGVGRPRD